MISDHKKIFGCSSNTCNQVTHLIIFSVKDVILANQKRKEGKEMVISDVKKCLLKNVNIINSKDVVLDCIIIFENKWNSFIRGDIHTRK